MVGSGIRQFAIFATWSLTCVTPIKILHYPLINISAFTVWKVSERPTLQQQLKPFSAKQTTMNRSRSPSRGHSTTKTNNQPRDQELQN